MNNHETISVAEKIFVIKIARCYITEAVENEQSYKYPVDKWNSDYFLGEKGDPLYERQCLIMECGGSSFIESIFKHYNTFNNNL